MSIASEIDRRKLYEQIIKIDRLYKIAKSEILETSWDRGFPDYPDSVKTLMDALSASDWKGGNYLKQDNKAVLADIKAANLEQVRGLFTTYIRAERWGIGNWEALIKSGDIEPVIARARDLVVFGHDY